MPNLHTQDNRYPEPLSNQKSFKRRPISAVSAVNKIHNTPQTAGKSLGLVATYNTNKKNQLALYDFLNTNYRKKLIPQNMMYGKEELYDQNLAVKIQINEVKEENTLLRTRF